MLRAQRRAENRDYVVEPELRRHYAVRIALRHENQTRASNRLAR